MLFVRNRIKRFFWDTFYNSQAQHVLLCIIIHAQRYQVDHQTYFDELNMGLNPLDKIRLCTELVLKYPDKQYKSRVQRVTCNLTH